VGGDEFALLLPQTDDRTAQNLAMAIRGGCSEFNTGPDARNYEISISVGYSTMETPDQRITDLNKIADSYLRNRKLLNNRSSHSAIISSIMATLYEKSEETEAHAKRLARLSRQMGRVLGLPPNRLGELELFAMLHDIGKVGIDDRVLKKPGSLNEEEWQIMKTHCTVGYRIAKSSMELEHIAEYILTHHERWDGSGYPQGLRGEEIPKLSRILAVADAFDAMTQTRVYRSAMDLDTAVGEIIRNSGSQFDPEVVAAFLQVLKEHGDVNLQYIESGGSAKPAESPEKPE